VEKDKVYPKSWCQVSGRVLVDKKGVKFGIVREIMKRMGGVNDNNFLEEFLIKRMQKKPE